LGYGQCNLIQRRANATNGEAISLVAVIQVENATKIFRINQKDPGIAGAIKALFRPHYQDKVAVDRISFTVEPGEVAGYISVNGAGTFVLELSRVAHRPAALQRHRVVKTLKKESAAHHLY
jgi:ABC-type sugar transport system ATPase subunit